jgi:hypothetical protein
MEADHKVFSLQENQLICRPLACRKVSSCQPSEYKKATILLLPSPCPLQTINIEAATYPKPTTPSTKHQTNNGRRRLLPRMQPRHRRQKHPRILQEPHPLRQRRPIPRRHQRRLTGFLVWETGRDDSKYLTSHHTSILTDLS